MAGEIASLHTDSQDVAMIVAAHNTASRVGTDRYAEVFTQAYQAIRAAVDAARQPSEPAPDPRLDAGT